VTFASLCWFVCFYLALRLRGISSLFYFHNFYLLWFCGFQSEFPFDYVKIVLALFHTNSSTTEGSTACPLQPAVTQHVSHLRRNLKYAVTRDTVKAETRFHGDRKSAASTGITGSDKSGKVAYTARPDALKKAQKTNEFDPMLRQNAKNRVWRSTWIRLQLLQDCRVGWVKVVAGCRSSCVARRQSNRSAATYRTRLPYSATVSHRIPRSQQ
jgi:hypothetical protein